MLSVFFTNLVHLPTEILIPMRLIAYNRGSRKLIITTDSLDLPQPIVAWLQESVQYRALLDRILPVTGAAAATAMNPIGAAQPPSQRDALHVGEIFHL